MLRTILVLIASTTFIFHSEAFFINNKDIRRFFGFAPSKIYRIFKKGADDDYDIEESHQDQHYKKNYRDYPHSINEKLNKYSKEKPTDLLDIEDSNQHDNVEVYSKNTHKPKPNKESHAEEDKILKVKIVKDETSHKEEKNFAKVLFLVPDGDGGSKYSRGEDDELQQYFKKYYSGYSDPYHDDPSHFYQ